MDNISEEYQHYWETNMFFQAEELDGYLDNETLSGYYDSSSPDGPHSSSSSASKNIVSERNRRKKLNDRLFALRAVVPNISKMDKASIIKDAIEYIQQLHEQQKRIQAEICELESGRSSSINNNSRGGGGDYYNYNYNYNYNNNHPEAINISSSSSRPNKTSRMDYYDSTGSRSSSALSSSTIEVLELRVSYMKEKTVVVSLTCSKRTDTMVKLCEIFETLNLKIIAAHITAFPAKLLKTVFLEAEEEETEHLKMKIESAIASSNDPDSPMSI